MAQFWQLSANYSGITATGLINGFPVLHADTGASGETGFTTAPLNPFLIGKGNVFRIHVTAKTDGAKLNCSIEDAMTGDVIDTGNAAAIELPAGKPPHVIELKFDSPQDGFKRLMDVAKSTDAKTITDFALKLRDLLNKKDLGGLMKAFKPKFEAMAEAFGQPLEAMQGQAREMMQAFTSAKYRFDAADVDAQPCCDNKLWTLKDKAGNPLIRVEEDGGSMNLDVVAALLPDGPAVVL